MNKLNFSMNYKFLISKLFFKDKPQHILLPNISIKVHVVLSFDHTST